MAHNICVKIPISTQTSTINSNFEEITWINICCDIICGGNKFKKLTTCKFVCPESVAYKKYQLVGTYKTLQNKIFDPYFM
jgi:hypothetical protein